MFCLAVAGQIAEVGLTLLSLSLPYDQALAMLSFGAALNGLSGSYGTFLMVRPI